MPMYSSFLEHSVERPISAAWCSGRWRSEAHHSIDAEHDPLTDESPSSISEARTCEPKPLAAAIYNPPPRRSHDLRSAIALIETARRRLSVNVRLKPDATGTHGN